MLYFKTLRVVIILVKRIFPLLDVTKTNSVKGATKEIKIVIILSFVKLNVENLTLNAIGCLESASYVTQKLIEIAYKSRENVMKNASSYLYQSAIKKNGNVNSVNQAHQNQDVFLQKLVKQHVVALPHL